MKRGALLLLACVALLTTCRAAPVTHARPATDPRPAILARDIAWIADTIPLLRFEPPFFYAVLRWKVEQCSGLSRAGWPRLYLSAINPLPGNLMAFYASDSESIVFALGNETRPEIVAHELMHWLLKPVLPPKPRGHESDDEFVARVHPSEYFERRCGHLIRPPQAPTQ